ncbi:glycoside hydrolase family 23 protein [Pseudohyphozyma bogoriensis]|nr:glycoside hydrolase family 23 protein [Pseudohyphozyma bogoriensis]
MLFPFFILSLALVSAPVLAIAQTIHANDDVAPRFLALPHQQQPPHRILKRRSCRARNSSSTSTTSPETTTTASSIQLVAAVTPHPTSSSAATASSPSASPSSQQGLFGVTDPTCGESGATQESTAGGGPNGAEKWLDCGISQESPDDGWTPPSVSLSQIKTISLSQAMELDNSPFAACGPYVDLFNSIGSALGLPPILLASFAMQESSCDPTVVGDKGHAWGLMQITDDKCGGAPNGDCSDPEFNIRTGAEYFQQVLDEFNGNLLLALGRYKYAIFRSQGPKLQLIEPGSGWYAGMSYNSANAIRSECCQCVNNLDYMQQMLNWWVLGKDGSTAGTFRNSIC